MNIPKLKGDWKNGTNTPFSENYDNILPNLTFSKKIDMGKKSKT